VSRVRPLAAPRPIRVEVGAHGVPVAVGRAPVARGGRSAEARAGGSSASVAVEAVREDWVVEDRWWTDRPLRRRYFELVLADGRDIVVFHDLAGGGWLAQRA
jgi:hypothetical protein